MPTLATITTTTAVESCQDSRDQKKTNKKHPPSSSSSKDTKKPAAAVVDDGEDAMDEEAFQALLNSQREILAKLGFDDSASELPYAVTNADGTEETTVMVVSPNASYNDHYDGQEDVYYPPPPPMSYSNSHSYSNNSNYRRPSHPNERYYYPQGYARHYSRPQQQQQDYEEEYPQEEEEEDAGEYYYRESLRESQHSLGVGDDSFILDHQLTIDSPKMKQRKRQTEQEFMEVVQQRKQKKQRRGSFTPSFADDDTTEVVDNNELDESSSSLLLDDLDFPSIHDDTESSMYRPREDPLEQEAKESLATNNKEEEQTSEPSSEGSIKKKRSQRGMWKPRRPSQVFVEVVKEDTNTTIKPTLNDSCVSLQLEDLMPPATTTPATSTQSQPKTLQVSILNDGEDEDDEDDSGDDVTMACDEDDDDMASSTRTSPSRRRRCSDSSYGNPPLSPRSMVAALQHSLNSTKTIQEWDRKMGLKRSHSKTMQLSCKSREQLLAFLRQEHEQRMALQQQLQQATAAAEITAAAEEADLSVDNVAEV